MSAQGKVLYIEDNPTNMQVMQAMFARLISGVMFIPAVTAEDGLSVAREVLPDLILMDINLPGMDGMAALQVIRGDPDLRHIPVIAVSADVTRRDLPCHPQATFDDFIAKPINFKIIAELVNAHVLKKGKNGNGGTNATGHK